jgi:hypothetical protein
LRTGDFMAIFLAGKKRKEKEILLIFEKYAGQ